MPPQKRHLGNWGEMIALDFLISKGDVLLCKNFRTEHGELDLVMRRGQRIVFVEVKTRSNDRYGPPETSITQKKQINLISSAEKYLEMHAEHDKDWQIDVISIRLFANLAPEITHFENAIPD